MKRTGPLVFAILAFFLLAVAWIVTDRRAPQRVFDGFSSANTSKDGLSLARGYLGKHRKVAMLTTSIGRARLEPNAVVFRVADRLPLFFDPEDLDEKQVGPPRPKKLPLLTERDEAFVRGGGRIIIAARRGALDAIETKEKIARKVLPVWPAVKHLPLTEEAEEDEEEDGCACAVAFSKLRPRMIPLFVAGANTVLARERIGRGELFVLSAPELLRNDQLMRNLALLTALAGEKRPVYFDEVMHGITSGEGALSLMKDWNLGPFLLMLALIALLVFWRGSRRVGPAEDDARETRSDAVDLVRSLAALYHGVTSDSEAISLYYEALTRAVAHGSGLRGEALRKRVDDLTGGLVPPKGAASMPPAVFAKQLKAINEGFAVIGGR